MLVSLLFFFFNDTATTEIYTLSLHDALPISEFDKIETKALDIVGRLAKADAPSAMQVSQMQMARSEEHTSELQSLAYLVCRLLLEKKKNNANRRLRGWRASTAARVNCS